MSKKKWRIKEHPRANLVFRLIDGADEFEFNCSEHSVLITEAGSGTGEHVCIYTTPFIGAVAHIATRRPEFRAELLKALGVEC